MHASAFPAARSGSLVHAWSLQAFDDMPTIRATAGIVDSHANFADGEGEANVAEGGNHAGARVFVVRSHGDVCIGQGVNARSGVLGEGGNKAAEILALACTLQGGFGQCRSVITRGWPWYQLPQRR